MIDGVGRKSYSGKDSQLLFQFHNVVYKLDQLNCEIINFY